ncbi:MAG: SCO family protein [Flavobacteriaceae bacterium]|jgi:protein SCO1/2|nr:SCO family protein [Flavobacteriaceae bacterium]
MYLKIVNILLIITIVTSCNSNHNDVSSSKLHSPKSCKSECETTNSKACCEPDGQFSEKIVQNASDMDENSIFNLTSSWQNQDNKSVQLRELKGKTLVLVMFYTSCKSICPRLVADMKSIEKQIPENKRNLINFVLVSIDPETDNPKVLKEFALKNQLTASYWTLLQGNKNTVQEFANVLSVKYKQIAPMDFSHSNIITVMDKNGILVHQQEGLGVNNDKTVKEIKKLL